MNNQKKIIRDPIHGNIQIDGIFNELLESPEVQHLYNVKQLGFAHLVYPGAHHTRLEHSLGSYFLSLKVSESLGLDKYERDIIGCASILHDIGHGPFSHTLESILRESFNVDHVDLTEKLIFGEYDIYDSKEKKYISSTSVSEILEKNGIDKKIITDIIKGKKIDKIFLSQIMNNTVDVDQLDYLIRDAYYTGVAYGMIDIERFIQTLLVKDKNLSIEKKGVGVIENILMARSLMYSSVYFHKTVRIAELMLSKAIELIEKTEPFEFFKMTDAELINELRNMSSYQYEIATRLKYRSLFKQAFSKSYTDLNENSKEVVKLLEKPKIKSQKEQEIEEKLDIARGHVIIDIPFQEIHLAEPRIDQTSFQVIDGNQIKNLEDFTPVANAVKSRSVPDWAVMIITDEKYRDVVSEKAEKILFN